MESLKEKKSRLRFELRAEIAALSDEYINKSNDGIYENMTSLEEFKIARTIFLYYSVERETATIKIAETALKAGKTVTFPFCYRGGVMEARAVSSLGELQDSMLGIPAPREGCRVIAPDKLDFIIVPALTYDSDRYRLGYGGGYYDRFLKNLSAFTAGVARGALLRREKLPREAFDIPVKCIVTENGVIY